MAKQLLRLGQPVPVDNSLIQIDVVLSGKLIKQLLKEPDSGICYVTFNSTVMAIAGDLSLLQPFIEADRAYFNAPNGTAKEAEKHVHPIQGKVVGG